MATEVGSIFVRVKADTDDFDRGLANVDKKMGGTGKGLGLLGKAGAAAGIAVGTGFALLVKSGVSSLMDHEKADAQTAAALKATGKAANVSAIEIKNHADKIEKLSGIDDVAVQAGENLLLTFKNLKNGVGEGNDIYNQAVDVMADMSVAMGQDMSTSAIQMGKALNDPVGMMGALTRVGVTFTDQQKEQIKEMVKSGDLMGAQKIILQELTSEFGGSAEALGGTVAGKIGILKARLEEMGEALATKLMPYAERFIDWVTNVAKSDGAKAVMEGLGGALKTLGEKVGAVGRFFSEHEGAAKAFGIAIAGIMAAIVVGKISGWISEFKGIGSLVVNLGKMAGIGLGPWGIATAAGIVAVAFGIKKFMDANPNKMVEALDDIADATDNLRDNIEGLNDAQLKLEGSHLAVERSTIDLSKAQDALAETTEAVRTNQINGKPAVDALKEANLNLKEAELGLKTAMENERKAADSVKEGHRGVTEETLNANLAIEAMTEATDLAIDTFGNAPEIIKEYVGKLRAMAEELGGAETQAGLTATVVADLTEKIKAVPPEKIVKIIEQGAAQGRTRAQLLKAAIDALTGKTVTITTSFVQVGSNPLVGGASLGQNAGGTRNWRGGMTMVGERGPELVNLPKGSEIMSNAKTRSMMSMPSEFGQGGSSMGTMPTPIVHVYIDGKPVAAAVRTEQLAHGRRNPTIFTGRGIAA